MLVLNLHNYVDWKIKMVDLLIVKDLYKDLSTSLSVLLEMLHVLVIYMFAAPV